MKYIHFALLFIFATLVFTSCNNSDDFKLSQSVFIHDTDYPGLPIYSEWGYNTFGAYLDRTPFISDNYLMPVKVMVKPDTCLLAFTGRTQVKYEEATLTFYLLNVQPKTFFELLSLDKRTFDLSDKHTIVSFRNGTKTDTLRVTEGVFVIKKAQKLLVDKEEKKVVLSGTFSMKASTGKEPISINNGRFDVSVDDVNFFGKR
ncbi:MAG: hypothetical protein Q4G63_00520 [Bacteroidia bacterium]|nr:hypothetical protein [Bacteroidia bacterium]